MPRPAAFVRSALVGTAAGGLLLGGGGRLAMRGVTLLAGSRPGFSVGGTLEVLAFGAIVGAVAGALYPWVRRVLPAATVVRGLLLGILTLVALALLRVPSVVRSASGFPNLQVEVLLVFLPTFLLFGLALAAWGDPRGPKEPVAP